MYFILDREEKIIGTLQKGKGKNIYFEDILSSDLESGSEVLVFSTIATREIMAKIKTGNYIAFKKDKDFKLMQIIETTEIKEEVLIKEVYCESAGLELINSVFEETKLDDVDVKRFLETILQDTDWKCGFVSDDLTRSLALDIQTEEVYSILQKNIKSFNAEIEFRVSIKNNRVEQRYIDVYSKRGSQTPKRLEIRRDIKKITRKIDMRNFATKLIGVGNRNLSFRDIETSDKPLGQNFITNEKAYNLLNKKGKHIVRKFTFNTDDPRELLKQTKLALEQMGEPKVTYEIECDVLDFDSLNVGDTVLISDLSFEPPLMISTRVSLLETSRCNKENNKVTLSNAKELSSQISRPIGEKDILDNAINENHLKPKIISGKHIKANIIETDHLKSKIIKTEHLQANTIVAGSGIIADGAIGSAQINELDARKISSGFIDTAKVKVIGANGHLQIKNNRLQIFDGVGENAYERVVLGDVNGDETVFGLRIRGIDGKTVLFNEKGVTKEGITDGSISNKKISDDANIDGSKLNIDTVISSINNNGTEMLKGTKIQVQGSTLSAKLYELTEKQEENLKISKMNKTTIESTEKKLSLKVDEQVYKSDKSNMINSLNKNTASIETLKNQISLKVEKTYVENAINNLQIGGRNLLHNSDCKKGLEYYSIGSPEKNGKIEVVDFQGRKCIKFENVGYWDVSKYLTTNGFSILKDEKATFSADIYLTSGNDMMVDFAGVLDVGDTHLKIPSNNKWFRLKATSTKGAKEDGNASISFYSGLKGTTISGYMTLLKAEKGDKATDWTPSPEDVDNNTKKITKEVAEIKVTSKSIESKVSNLTGKYSKLEQTINGFNFTGFVKFNDLSSAGSTKINGGNIISQTLCVESLRGGTLKAMDTIEFGDSCYISKMDDSLGGMGGMLISSAKVKIHTPQFAVSSNITVPEIYCTQFKIGNNVIIKNGEMHIGYNNFYNSYSRDYVSNLTVRNGNVSVAHDIWADNFNSRITGGSVTGSKEENTQSKNNPFDTLGRFNVVANEESRLRLFTTDIFDEDKLKDNACLLKDINNNVCLDNSSILAHLVSAVNCLKKENEEIKERLEKN